MYKYVNIFIKHKINFICINFLIILRIPEKIRHLICWFWSAITIDHFATGMKILDWN